LYNKLVLFLEPNIGFILFNASCKLHQYCRLFTELIRSDSAINLSIKTTLDVIIGLEKPAVPLHFE
jgi:hypothetical protein